jgi:thiol-disulfide isomerase/thioredoxin
MHFKVLSEQDAVNLSDKLRDGDWMVLYYADWCGHCQTMKPEWQKVVSKFSGNQAVNVAEVESTLIDKLAHKPQVQGFPTIKMYQSGNEVAQFQDERVADKMEKFALSNSSKHSKRHVTHHRITHRSKPSVHRKSSHRTKRHVTHHRITHHRKPQVHRSKPTHHTKRHVTHHRKPSNKPSQKSNTVQSVFNKLIKSFGRIGNEAEKDKKLLQKTKPMMK